MTRHPISLLAGLVLAATQSIASADVVVLDFEGVGDGNSVGQYYNGVGGPNHGITFSSNTLVALDADVGGIGNFANEPSPDGVMFFLDGDRSILNMSAGFTNGFSFYYSSLNEATVTVYDGLDATGTVLGSLSLVAQYNDNCTGDPTGNFRNWTPIGISFAGTAHSIEFLGAANYVAFDDITFGSATAGGGGDNGGDGSVPEPGSLALLGFGLAGLAASRMRKSATRARTASMKA